MLLSSAVIGSYDPCANLPLYPTSHPLLYLKFDNWDIKFVRNVCKHLPIDTASHIETLESLPAASVFEMAERLSWCLHDSCVLSAIDVHQNLYLISYSISYESVEEKLYVLTEQRVKIVGFLVIVVIIIILLFLNNWILNNVTECLGHIVSTSASCRESPGFKSLQINQLHWLPLSLFSSVHSRQISHWYVKLSRDICLLWARWRSRYSDCLRAGRFWGSNPSGGEIFRTCPDQPWRPPSLLYNGYRVFPGGKVRRGVTLTPHPLLLPRSKIE